MSSLGVEQFSQYLKDNPSEAEAFKNSKQQGEVYDRYLAQAGEPLTSDEFKTLKIGIQGGWQPPSSL